MLGSVLTRIWLNVKQHRFEVYAVLAVAAIVTIGDLIEAFRLNSISAPAACNQSLRWAGMAGGFGPSGNVDPCAAPSRLFQPIADEFDVTALRAVGAIFPFIAAIVLGIPIVAREVEQGTAPQAFALAGSRTRWLAWKAGSMFLVLLVAIIPVAIATNVLYVALNRGLDAQAAFGDYEFRGAMAIGWAVAGFAGGVALSCIVRRTLPSVILGLVSCGVAIALSFGGMQHFVMTPMAQPQADPSVFQLEGNSNKDTRADLFVYGKQYLKGREINDQELNDWFKTHMVTTTGPTGGVTTTDPGPVVVGPDGQPVVGPDGQPLTATKPEDGPYFVGFAIPGTDYWKIVGIELAFMLGGAVVFGGLAAYAVNRRRPY